MMGLLIHALAVAGRRTGNLIWSPLYLLDVYLLQLFYIKLSIEIKMLEREELDAQIKEL